MYTRLILYAPTVLIAHTTGLQSGSEKPLLDTKYVVIVAVCLSVVILVAVGIIAWCICVRVRHHKRTAKFPTLPPEDRRRYVHCTSQRLVTESRKFVTSQTAFPKNICLLGIAVVFCGVCVFVTKYVVYSVMLIHFSTVFVWYLAILRITDRKCITVYFH